MQPIFKERDFTDSTQPSLKWKVDKLTFGDVGGPVEARLTATGTQEELYRLTSMMRAPVDIYDDLGQWVWGGYLSELTIGSGAYSYGVQLDTMANKIAVAYSFVEPGTNNVGVRKTTAFTTDANSIAEYGTKEAILSESGLSDAMATAKRDTALEAKYAPQGVLSWGSSDETALVICRGWFDTLAWRLASWASVAGPSFTTNNTDVNIASGTAVTKAMQQITTGAQAINVLNIGAYAKKVGSPTDNMVIGLYAIDTTGNPTGSSLAEIVTAGTAISTSYGLISGAVTEVELAAGTVPGYAIEVSRSGTVDASNYYVWGGDTGLGYAGGTARVYGGTVWSALATPRDMTFTTQVNNKVQSLTQLKDLTTQYGQFIVSQVFEISASITPALPSYRDGDTDTLTEIMALLDAGTTNGRKIIVKVDKDRRAIWSEEPASTTIGAYISRNGKVTDANEADVVPYIPPVGVWAQLSDVPFTADSSLLIDASKQYITGAEWGPGDGLQLEFRGNDNLGKSGAGAGADAKTMKSLFPLILGRMGTANNTSVTSVTTTYAVLPSDRVIRCTGTFTVTIYAATGSGARHTIKSVTGTITVARTGTDTIDGATSDTLAANASETYLDAELGKWEII